MTTPSVKNTERGDRPAGDDAGPKDVQNRSLNKRPIDANSLPAKGRFPPGVDAEDVADPGRQTPDAPPVDNRSGNRS